VSNANFPLTAESSPSVLMQALRWCFRHIRRYS